MIMRSFVIAILLLLIVHPCFGQYYPLRPIEEKTVYSDILKEDRPILISKPNGYAQSDENYFVVYVLDGNLNMYATCGIAELLYQSGYPKLLIVGVPSTHRSRDLTPTAVADTPTGGGASPFMAFMDRELKPFIQKHYRTHDYSVLIGHSFGGLFATQVLYENPDLFDGYVAITPTVVYDDFLTGNALQHFFKETKTLNKSFFFSVGHEPGAEGDAVFQLDKAVFKKYAPEHLDWKFVYYPNENHSTTPLIATLDGLRFIFKDLVPNEAWVHQNGFTKTLGYYEGLTKKYGKQIDIPQRVLMNYGYAVLGEKKDTEAFAVFRYYRDRYPHIPVGYDGLAILHERNNEKEQAIANLKKLLELDPNYEDAQKRLEELELNHEIP